MLEPSARENKSCCKRNIKRYLRYQHIDSKRKAKRETARSSLACRCAGVRDCAPWTDTRAAERSPQKLGGTCTRWSVHR